MLKKISAKSSRAPNFLAHQASEVPHPSQVPQLDFELMVVVVSATARGPVASAKAQMMKIFCIVTMSFRMGRVVQKTGQVGGRASHILKFGTKLAKSFFTLMEGTIAKTWLLGLAGSFPGMH